jgi:hypothetical protein
MCLLRIRTITVFLKLGPPESWEQQVAAAGTFLAQAQQQYLALGELPSCAACPRPCSSAYSIKPDVRDGSTTRGTAQHSRQPYQSYAHYVAPYAACPSGQRSRPSS